MKKLVCVIIAAAMLFASLPSLAQAKREGGEATRSVVEEPEETVVVSWDFDGEIAVDGWEFLDTDGDGHNWELNTDASFSRSGSCSITSASYISGVGALDPDNWAITPAISVPKEYAELTFWGRISLYTGIDTFAVYAGISPDPAVMRPITPKLAFRSTEFEQMRIDISAYAGQTVYFAFVHSFSRNQYAFFIDDVAVVTGCEPELPPDNLLFSESFESDFNIDEWTLVDANEDGKNWEHNTSAAFAHEGVGYMRSRSYAPNTFLIPDNWLISPEISLPDEGLELTFWASGNDRVYYNECFSVYVGRAPFPDTMDLVLSEVVTGPNYQMYTVDLSAYAYETVHIAIRHHKNGNENWLRVDEFKVWGSGSYQPPEPEQLPNYGDIDLNGNVEVTDGLMLMRYLICIEPLYEEQLLLADVQGDGNVALEDSLLIMRYALGSIPYLPIQNMPMRSFQ